MSVYWRWVVAVGGVSALASTSGIIARFEISSAPAWLAAIAGSTVVALVAVIIRLAEAGVIKSAFPRLSMRDYILYSMPLILLTPITEAARFLAGLITGGPDAASSNQPSGPALLADILLLLLFIALIIKCFFLQWRAIGEVAEGRESWRNTILLGCVCAIIAVLAYAKIAGLQMRPTDLSNWLDVQVRLPMTVIGSFSYALISGIGVARLIPKPWAVA